MLKLVVTRRFSIPHLPDPDDPSVQVWRLPHGPIFAYSHCQKGDFWLHLPETACFRFNRGTDRITALAQPDAKEHVIQAAFDTSVLPVAMQALGWEVLHASATVIASGLVAFCGDPGAGKSTIVYGLAQMGYPLWADDTLVFDLTQGKLSCVPLPTQCRLRRSAADFFRVGGLSPESTENIDSTNQANYLKSQAESEKVLAIPPGPSTSRLWPLKYLSQLRRWTFGGKSLPLGAVLILDPLADKSDSPGEAKIIRLSPTRSFTAVLGHACAFSLADKNRKKRLLKTYLFLAEHVPVFLFRYVPRLSNLQVMLKQIVHTVQQ